MNTSFENIVSRISPVLRRITHRLNGHFAFFDDDDLFQEALIYLWLAFQNGILSDKTDSYILQGCYFHLKNYLRVTLDKAKLISLYQIIDEDDTALAEILPADNMSISNDIDDKLLAEEAELKGLTEQERRVLSFSMEGLTTREIGQRLGVSHVTVVKIKGKIRCKYGISKTKYAG